MAEFTGAQLNPSVDPQAFKYEVPADAETVSFFMFPHPGQLLAKKVPDFKFVDFGGKPITPQSLAGKIVVIDFWSTSCVYCKLSLPELQKVYEKYKDNDKIVFLAVSVDEPKIEDKIVEEFFKELKLSIPICRDKDESSVVFKYFGHPHFIYHRLQRHRSRFRGRGESRTGYSSSRKN